MRNSTRNNCLEFRFSYLCSSHILILMKTGTVKFFNESKGFGFIIEADSNQEYFVHVTGIIDEIKEGDNVEFELKEGRKGLNAINVKIV